MPRCLLLLENVSYILPHKPLFTGFYASVYEGQKIALIGNNGSGKTTLLGLLQGLYSPSDGKIIPLEGLKRAGVSQILESYENLSGGQRFQRALTQVLHTQPDLLFLDEPTNHLDTRNRHSLIEMLRQYKGTVIFASHDVALLKSCAQTLWHLNQGNVHIFPGAYAHYLYECQKKTEALREQIKELERGKKEAHLHLMKEQERAKKRKRHGEKKYGDDKLALRSAQGRGERTTNRNKKNILHHRKELSEQLNNTYVPSVLRPRFFLPPSRKGEKALVGISKGACGYEGGFFLQDIYLTVSAQARLALTGSNGSGKSTLMKALLGDSQVKREGSWILPSPHEIGYLDQHYKNLSFSKTVFETLQELRPDASHREIREILNRFLFSKNEDVHRSVSSLSGGEKARLSLAQISVKTPKLLLLDELTNNLDLQTRDHVIQVLKEFPGTLVIISHDPDFLENVSITQEYALKAL